MTIVNDWQRAICAAVCLISFADGRWAAAEKDAAYVYHLTDIDNTFIPHVPGDRPEIERRDLSAYLDASEGLERIPVTGRVFEELREILTYTQLAEIFPGPWIVAGGQRIVTPEGDDYLQWRKTISQGWNRKDVERAMVNVMLRGPRHAFLFQDPHFQGQHAVKFWVRREFLPRELQLAAWGEIAQVFLEPLVRDALREQRLDARNIAFTVSHDPVRDLGNFDVTPAKANKLNAVRFLLGQKHGHGRQVIFTGDSMNDLSMTKLEGVRFGIPSNGQQELKRRAREQFVHRRNQLYLAKNPLMRGVTETLRYFRSGVRSIHSHEK